MSIPIPYFTFTTTLDLKAKFKNLSYGEPADSYLWEFGPLANPPTSDLETPPEITFPAEGVYEIKLTATNSYGSSSFTYLIVLRNTPELNITILEMVLVELPISISVTQIGYNHLVRKWQMFFYKGFSIPAMNIFDESRWPSMINNLIAKLILHDIMITVARNNIAISSSGSSTQIQTTPQLLSEYRISEFTTFPITITYIRVNGSSIAGPVDPIANLAELVNWFNALNKGVFILEGNDIVTLRNPHLYQDFVYRLEGDPVDTVITMVQSNQVIVNTSSTNILPGGQTLNVGGKGPVKSIETGPAKAEWYDSGTYWKNMFEQGGLIEQLRMDACMYASSLGVRLSFCPNIKKTHIFIVTKKNRKCY